MENNKIILARHGYDDHSYIDGENNTSLTADGIKVAKESMEKIAAEFCGKHIIVRHSVKKRAKETAEILCDQLTKGSNQVERIADHGLTELFQGKFNFDGMEHIERVNFLQSCWDDFESEREKGNLYHRFGQNKNRNIMLCPGEHHAEWSARIAGGLMNMLNDLHNNCQSINITHRGAMLQMQNLTRMLNGEIEIEQVEKYKTIPMKYCQDFVLEVNDVVQAKQILANFIQVRLTK